MSVFRASLFVCVLFVIVQREREIVGGNDIKKIAVVVIFMLELC